MLELGPCGHVATSDVVSLVQALVRGLDVVDLGGTSSSTSRCLAATARSVTAVMPSSSECVALRGEQLQSALSVECKYYTQTCIDADVYTWWKPPTQSPSSDASSTNEDNGIQPLQWIEKLVGDGLLRPSVTIVLVFSHDSPMDMRRWGHVRPIIHNFTTLSGSRNDPRTFTVAIVRRLWGLWGAERQRLPGGACDKTKPNRKKPGSTALPPPSPPSERPLLLPQSVEDRGIEWHVGGSWTGPADPNDHRCVSACDMVIAHCDEALEWIPVEAKRFRQIIVYTKCGSDLDASLRTLPNVEFIAAPNVGSNDFANLQHIIRRYDALAPLTLFCEGGSDSHYMCIPDAVLPPRPRAELSRALPGDFEPDADRALFPGLNYKWIRPNKPASFFRSFRRKRDYRFESSNRTFAYVRSNFADMGEWLADLVGTAAADELFSNSGVYVQFGGFYAARRHEIRRFPRALYQAMADQQVAPNEEVDHYIERLWGILFSAPRVPPTLAAYVVARANVTRTRQRESHSLIARSASSGNLRGRTNHRQPWPQPRSVVKGVTRLSPLSSATRRSQNASEMRIYVSEFLPMLRLVKYPRIDNVASLTLSSAFGEDAFCAPRAGGLCVHTDERFVDCIGRVYPDQRDATLFDQYATERRMLTRFLHAPGRCRANDWLQCGSLDGAMPDVVVIPSLLSHCPWRPDKPPASLGCREGLVCSATSDNSSDLLMMPPARFQTSEKGVCTQRPFHKRYWSMVRSRFFSPAKGWTPLIVVHHPVSLDYEMGYVRAFLTELALLEPPAFAARIVIATFEGDVPNRYRVPLKPPEASSPQLVPLPYSAPVRTPWSHDSSADRHRPVAVLLAASLISQRQRKPFRESNKIRPAIFEQVARHSAARCDRSAGLCVVCDAAYSNGCVPAGLAVSGRARASALELPADMPGRTTFALALSSVFCIEPAGDTPTRSHLYVAVLSGCIPVLFNGGHDDFAERTWWAWRAPALLLDGTRTLPDSAVDYDTFAVTVNASDVAGGAVDVVTLLTQMMVHEPKRVAALQEGVARVAPLMRIARGECHDNDRPCDVFSMFVMILHKIRGRLVD